MADATTCATVRSACDGPEAASSPRKAAGFLSTCLETLRSRSRRSSMSSECSDDSCSSECSTSGGRAKFMGRLKRCMSLSAGRDTTRCSEDSSSSMLAAAPLCATAAPPSTDAEAADSCCVPMAEERVGWLLRGSPVRIVAPDEFLDPLTDCLILEPVTLLNTNTTLDRLTLQEWLRAGNRFCPRTHTPLNDWICVRANDDLRARIAAWAERANINLEALVAAHYAKQTRA